MSSVYSEYMRAFSLVELIVVIGLAAILVTAGGVNIARHYQLVAINSELELLAADLRTTRQNAIANENGESYSVRFFNNSYTIFPGDSFDADDPNNQDYDFDLVNMTSTDFPNDQFTFASFTGRIGSGGEIRFASNLATHTLFINSLGIVENFE